MATTRSFEWHVTGVYPRSLGPAGVVCLVEVEVRSVDASAVGGPSRLYFVRTYTQEQGLPSRGDVLLATVEDGGGIL